MLSKFRTATARAARPRTFRTAIGPPCHAATTRACHVATGEFTNLQPDGTVVTKEISIRVGDPGEAYVLIPTEVGNALQAGSSLTNNLSALPKRPDRFALSYFHDTQHFALSNRPPSDVYILLIS